MLRWFRKHFHRHDFKEFALVDIEVESWLTGHEVEKLPFIVLINSPGGLRPKDAWFVGFFCPRCRDQGYGTDFETVLREMAL